MTHKKIKEVIQDLDLKNLKKFVKFAPKIKKNSTVTEMYYATVVTLRTQVGTIKGYAIAGPMDEVNPKIGLNVAMGRALKELSCRWYC